MTAAVAAAGAIAKRRLERGRPRSRPVLLQALKVAQAGLCYLCGGALPAHDAWRGRYPHSKADPDRTSFDHVVPLALGGEDDWRNILLAHQRCNNEKDSRRPRPCELLYLAFIRFMMPTRALNALAGGAL